MALIRICFKELRIKNDIKDLNKKYNIYLSIELIILKNKFNGKLDINFKKLNKLSLRIFIDNLKVIGISIKSMISREIATPFK